MKIIKHKRETARITADIDAEAKRNYDAAVEDALAAGYVVDTSAVVELAFRQATRRIRATLAGMVQAGQQQDGPLGTVRDGR